VISETGGPRTITKNVNGTGNSVLALGAANTFTGGVVINGGIVQINNPGALNATTPNSVTLNAGASAVAPEHTLAGYRLAVEMKADYLEQDLQRTRDGVLVCIHDDTLERTTDVETVFPTRFRTVTRDGVESKVWPVADFTLAEIKQLDAGSWFSPQFADQRVPTFAESIAVARDKLGIYPELKKSQFIPADAPDVVQTFHAELAKAGLDQPEARKTTPVVVQSFHPEMLRTLRKLSNHGYPLIQLIWLTQVADLLSDHGLDEVATYADGIGPIAAMLLDDPTRVAAAHQRGLVIHVWYLDKKLPSRFSTQREYDLFLLDDLGVDGLFCDAPDQFPRTAGQ